MDDVGKSHMSTLVVYASPTFNIGVFNEKCTFNIYIYIYIYIYIFKYLIIEI